MSKIIGKLNPKSNQRLIVYDKKHNSPTLQCAMGTGGGQVPLIIIEKIDIIENIKKYGNKKGVYKPFNKAVCYPLTSQDFIRTGFLDICPTLTSRDYKDPKCIIQVKTAKEQKVKIKQATKKGFIECRVGGVVDMSYPNSKTRRGRVINKGEIAPTIQCNENNILRIEKKN